MVKWNRSKIVHLNDGGILGSDIGQVIRECGVPVDIVDSALCEVVIKAKESPLIKECLT